MSTSSIDTRNYKSVSASSSDTDTRTPANGSTIYIHEMGGSAAVDNDVKVEIQWDGTVIFATHGDMVHRNTELEYACDGVKQLKIILTNDSGSSETIGAYYCGKEVT